MSRTKLRLKVRSKLRRGRRKNWSLSRYGYSLFVSLRMPFIHLKIVGSGAFFGLATSMLTWLPNHPFFIVLATILDGQKMIVYSGQLALPSLMEGHVQGQIPSTALPRKGKTIVYALCSLMVFTSFSQSDSGGFFGWWAGCQLYPKNDVRISHIEHLKLSLWGYITTWKSYKCLEFR